MSRDSVHAAGILWEMVSLVCVALFSGLPDLPVTG